MRRRIHRLQEPRYLVGLAVALAYFGLVLFRSGGRRLPARPPGVSPELLLVVPILAAAGLLVASALAWIFRKGSSALSLTEGEAQFLFAGPLPRRAVVHFALLRPQIGLLGAALFITLLSRRGTPADAVRTAFGTWLLLTTSHLHLLAVGFTKAAWAEEPPGRRRAKKTAAALAALVLVSGVAGTLAHALARASDAPGRHGPSLVAFQGAFLSGPLGRVPIWILAPFRAVLEPVLAPDGARFVRALPAALCVLGFLYVWVLRKNVHYEEATLESAARRAANRARREAGRMEGLPSADRRRRLPFPLGPTGRPEVAILWKNLIAWNRSPIRRTLAGVAAAGVALFLAALVVSRSGADAAAATGALVIVVVSAALATTMTLGFRNDLRADLAEAATLKLWPLASRRLVAGELAAPFLLSILFSWSGLYLALALAAGRALRALALGDAGPDAVGGLFRLGALLPVALGAAVFLPALVSAALVLQNGATLAFPSWFPPGPRTSAGLEHVGIRMVAALATLFVLAVALVPSAVLVALLVLLLWKTLGLWTVSVAGFAAALPLFAEAAAGVSILAKLWDRFDPALDLGA